MPTVIKGQPPSVEIRKKLAAENRPVLVAFSCGKDSIATELALQEAGVETVCAYLYPVPPDENGRLLEFLEEELAELSDQIGKPIHRYPHISIYRMLNALVFQPPERISTIYDCNLIEPSYEDLWGFIREDLGLDADTWVADGVRAADSIQRRASLSRHGVMKPSTGKVSPIADWLKAEVMDIIDRHHVRLPIDYQWFGRSFDGLDYRFLKPIHDHAPDDYRRILDWFPLAELELIRHDLRQARAASHRGR